jgi:phosphonopyruvate decarboxylase
MINCKDLFNILNDEGLTFFSGVPDSTFKAWTTFLLDEKKLTNIIAVNECEAVAICAGYHIATGRTGIVYMQNSGLGKAVNPVTSLADPEVYSIPMLLMVGWRGRPGIKDEPQHKKMGKITIPILKTLGIPHIILSHELARAKKEIRKANKYMSEKKSLFAIIINKGLFEDYKQKREITQEYEMRREDAVKTIIDLLKGDEIIISTTGKTSRELFEYREEQGKSHKTDFYTVGSMGCSSSIALGIAMQKKDKKIIIFDGDGAGLMQMGAFATIGHYKPENLIHILFDNESHESTGGQPTVSKGVDFGRIAEGSGYTYTETVKTKKELISTVRSVLKKKGPAFIRIKIRKGARKDLGRPTTTPIENKEALMDHLY